jgi:hypothetical protein
LSGSSSKLRPSPAQPPPECANESFPRPSPHNNACNHRGVSSSSPMASRILSLAFSSPRSAGSSLSTPTPSPPHHLHLAPLCWLVTADPVSASSPSPRPLSSSPRSALTMTVSSLCYRSSPLRATHGHVACRRVAGAGPTHARGDGGGGTGGGELGVVGGGRSVEVEEASRRRRRTVRRSKSRRDDGKRQSSTST